MARIVLLLALGILAYAGWRHLQQLPPEKRRHLLMRGGFVALFAAVLLLVATGRLHWIAAAVAAALPLLKFVFALLLRSLPLLQVWLKKRQQQNPGPPHQDRVLTEHDALQLLGLKPGASREEIIRAHKRLMQKLHPDRGGNDYLASQINAARDLLLKRHHDG